MPGRARDWSARKRVSVRHPPSWSWSRPRGEAGSGQGLSPCSVLPWSPGSSYLLTPARSRFPVVGHPSSRRIAPTGSAEALQALPAIFGYPLTAFPAHEYGHVAPRFARRCPARSLGLPLPRVASGPPVGLEAARPSVAGDSRARADRGAPCTPWLTAPVASRPGSGSRERARGRVGGWWLEWSLAPPGRSGVGIRVPWGSEGVPCLPSRTRPGRRAGSWRCPAHPARCPVARSGRQRVRRGRTGCVDRRAPRLRQGSAPGPERARMLWPIRAAACRRQAVSGTEVSVI